MAPKGSGFVKLWNTLAERSDFSPSEKLILAVLDDRARSKAGRVGLTPAHLARATGLDRTTAYRITTDLIADGLLSRDETGALTPAVAALEIPVPRPLGKRPESWPESARRRHPRTVASRNKELLRPAQAECASRHNVVAPCTNAVARRTESVRSAQPLLIEPESSRDIPRPSRLKNLGTFVPSPSSGASGIASGGESACAVDVAAEAPDERKSAPSKPRRKTSEIDEAAAALRTAFEAAHLRAVGAPYVALEGDWSHLRRIATALGTERGLAAVEGYFARPYFGDDSGKTVRNFGRNVNACLGAPARRGAPMQHVPGERDTWDGVPIDQEDEE